jgi:hypothetical protein
MQAWHEHIENHERFRRYLREPPSVQPPSGLGRLKSILLPLSFMLAFWLRLI